MVVAGTRDLRIDEDDVWEAYNKYSTDIGRVTEVVSGNSGNVDHASEDFARRHSYKLTLFPAKWKKYGRSAGPRRNAQMAEYADCLLLIWDGESRGSRNMRDEMRKRGKPVYEVVCTDYEEEPIEYWSD